MPDFNGDGKLDVVVANNGNTGRCNSPAGGFSQPFGNSISLFLGDGTGNFSSRQDIPSNNFPWAIVAADFNGDGKLDFAVTDEENTVGNTNPGYLTVYTNTSQ